MEVNALRLDPADNVVTCVAPVAKGSPIVYPDGEELRVLEAWEDIPIWHKAALEDLPEGGEVRKYGERIGRTKEPIPRGGWVSDKNIYSVPRDYDQEMIERWEGQTCNFGDTSGKKEGRGSATMC